MYTLCPECRKTNEISKEQLLENNLISCDGCGFVFNAFDYLSDNAPDAKRGSVAGRALKSTKKPKAKRKTKKRQPDKKTEVAVSADKSDERPSDVSPETNAREILPWEVERQPLNFNWSLGFWVGCAVLLGQLAYFETKNVSQNVNYREKFEVIAHWFGADLPDYKNINEFEVLQGALNTADDGNLWFKAAFSNQATFKQKLPDLKLTLLDNDGQLLAERIFPPKHYLSYEHNTKAYIAPDETVQARLHIASPKSGIGGYHFDLTY